MSKFKILHCESKNLAPSALAVLESVAEVTCADLDRKGLLQEIGNYDGLILRLGHRIDREVFEQSPRLKWVATPTTGIDHINAVEAESRGIKIISLKGDVEFLNGVTATAEHAFGLALTLVRKVPWAHASVLAGEWQRDNFRGRELKGLTLGILGFGRLGRMMASYGRAFGMAVIAYDPYLTDADFSGSQVRQGDLASVLCAADVVTLHVPLTDETRGLIGTREFALMKPGAFIINTSRGGVVDETALLKSLSDGHLGGAALDVLAGENAGRLSGDGGWLNGHSLVEYAAAHKNLLLTPHIGGLTTESLAKAETRLSELIVDFLQV